MKKHIASLMTVALMLGMLGISASAATILPESKGHLQASNASTGSITKDLTVGIDDNTVLQFPKGTEFSIADGIQLRVSSYDGKKFNLVKYLMPGETYTLETPGIIYSMDVQDSSFSSFETFVMIADGTGSTSTPTAPAQPATPPLSKILRTETRMVTVYGQAAKEVTIYYIPAGGGDFVGGNQPVTQLSLSGTHTDTTTGKTVYDLDVGGFFGVDTSINKLNTPDTIIEVGGGGEDEAVGTCFYVAFEGCTVFSDSGTTAPNTSTVSDWAKDIVAAADEAGLIPELTGNPSYQDVITREQFAELAICAAGVINGEGPDILQAKTFTDCTNPKVISASAAGIVDGVGDGRFNPIVATNREQIAVMVSRTIDYIKEMTGMNLTPTAANIDKYSDKGQVSAFAVDGVGRLAANGIMEGTTATTLSPKGSCTVEQSIVLLYRVYEQFYKQVSAN